MTPRMIHVFPIGEFDEERQVWTVHDPDTGEELAACRRRRDAETVAVLLSEDREAGRSWTLLVDHGPIRCPRCKGAG